MLPIRIFVSSVQGEFAAERRRLREYVEKDALLRRFFDVFLFEDVPASDQKPDHLYLDQIRRCDIYVGLFGSEYGTIASGADASPTEREFECAGETGIPRLVFVKDCQQRNQRMEALIAKVDAGLVRGRFADSGELTSGLYAALLEYLESKDLLRRTPFDASICQDAKFSDLDQGLISRFVSRARDSRSFPLPEKVSGKKVLAHLNLLADDKLTNAALLMFGKAPQRFFTSATIRCAHFHGTEVYKPIPALQSCKGSLPAMIDQAVDFVLAKIARSIGTRKRSAVVPVIYEIPEEVILEAIVNAVAHRDYSSPASVQVMLFQDRLEVWNPGRLAPSLTLAQLQVEHPSVPANPLLMEPLYLAKYVERMGTGTLDMINRCQDASLPKPEFSATSEFRVVIGRPTHEEHLRRLEKEFGPWPKLKAESRPESKAESRPESPPAAAVSQRDRIVMILGKNGGMSKKELAVQLGHKTISGHLNRDIRSLREAGVIEYTLPDKPQSRLQKYSLCQKNDS